MPAFVRAVATINSTGSVVFILPVRLRILGHRIILLCGRLAYPFGDTVGDKIAGMLKRYDVRATARRFFIADRQCSGAAM
jgi:hypothetical protein